VTVRNEVISVGVCHACGSEVRAESLYCYNCGGKVELDGAKPTGPEPINPGRNGSSAEGIDESIVDSTSVPRPSEKRRRLERKRVHVAWERTDRPGYLLLLFAVAVAVIVFVMLAVAAYLN
jgi:hypothetical protein